MTAVTGVVIPALSMVSTHGDTQALVNQASKLTLVVFLKTSCGACKTIFPYVERLHKGYGSLVHVVAVSQDDTEKTSRFADRYGCSFPFLLDTADFRASATFDPTGVPALYVLTPAGEIIWSAEGYKRSDVEALSAFLASALNVPTVSVYTADETGPIFRPACESKHRLAAQGLLDDE